MHHVQHNDILFILINAKMQKAFIFLVWFLLNYNLKSAAIKDNDLVMITFARL